jgi:hypothetical protein
MVGKKILFIETANDQFSTKFVLNLSESCSKKGVLFELLVPSKKQALHWNSMGLKAFSLPQEGFEAEDSFFTYQMQRVLGVKSNKFLQKLPNKDQINSFLLKNNFDVALTYVGPEPFKFKIKNICTMIGLKYRVIDRPPISGRLALVDTCFSVLDLSNTFNQLDRPSRESIDLFNSISKCEKITPKLNIHNKIIHTNKDISSKTLIKFSQLKSMLGESRYRVLILIKRFFTKKLAKIIIFFRKRRSSTEGGDGYFFATQSSTETAFLYGTRLIDYPDSLMLKVAEFVKQFSPIIFRLHPATANRLSIYALTRLVVNRLEISYKEESPLKAILASKAVIVWNSNFGFEAIIHGKPVITLADSFYGSVGLTHEIKSNNDLGKIFKYVENYEFNKEKVCLLIDSILINSFPEGDGYDSIIDNALNINRASE